MEENNNLTPTSFRKARTRTLIQLGGLLEKAGLMTEFNLSPGDDLQANPDIKRQVYALFGALKEMREMVIKGEFHFDLLATKGANAFQEKEQENAAGA